MHGFAAVLFACATITGGAQQRAGGDPVDAAKREFQQGNFDAALAILDELDKPGSPRAQSLDLRGSVLLEQRKLDEAFAAFRAAHETEPALFALRLHIGDALLRQQKWDEARAAYEVVMQETNILMSHEKLRFAVLLTYLGDGDKEGGQPALGRITFRLRHRPTTTRRQHGRLRTARSAMATNECGPQATSSTRRRPPGLRARSSSSAG
ncbi:MAG TPA: tetratricopeptide repeat protein [Chthoniobacterales bacterium]|nr:tetratricopeptide repeat protein [Chthoniobacterales bacterium]